MGELVRYRGTRQGFRLLLERLRELVPRDPRSPVSPPVALLVGSSAQRRLLLPRIAAELGGAVLGLEVLSAGGFARRVLEETGLAGRLREGETAFRLFVERAARRRPVLSDTLGRFERGELLALSPVRDLLGAGLSPEVGEALFELIEAETLPATVRDRARALVEVALEVSARMAAWTGPGGEARPLARNADRVALAAEAVAVPGAGLPWRVVLCWGIPDAPGRTADLLAALLRLPGTTVFLDEPPDPAAPDRPAPGEAFRTPFREALLAAAGRSVPPPAEPPVPPAVEAFHAAGTGGEAREIAGRILALVEAGVPPEEIAVVARGLDELLPSLAASFDEEGIPWSLFAPVPAGLDPGERRAASLATLLERGPAAPVDDWIHARDPAPRVAADLSLLLASRGCFRLDQLAATDPGNLPGRGGEVLLPAREPAGEDGERLARRTLSRDLVAREIEAARGFLARLGAGPPGRSPAEGAAWLRDLLAAAGERDDRAGEVSAALADALPAGFDLEREEILELAGAILRERSRRRPGGAGGGVRVMSALRARGIPFRHLFLAGMNRHVFPRIVRDDPLLPDALRRRLRDVLPALPLPLAGHDEERWLFAHLVAGADRVVLSWQRADADGRPRNPSPFVRGLELAGILGSPAAVPETPAPGDARTLEELAVAVGGAFRGRLAREVPRLAQAVGLLLGGAARRWQAPPGSADPARAAASRARTAALLEERPDPDRPDRLALPGFGFVVPGDTGRADGPPWVTFLEDLARCPWRAFLGRVLGILPPPDPVGPPGADDLRLAGTVTHRVLARLLAGERVGGSLDDRLAGPGSAPAMPDPGTIAAVTAEEAGRVLAEEGIPGEVPRRALERKVLPLVAGALERLGAPGGARVAGAELVAAAGGVRFRADLALLGDGELLLVDWKTGRPFTNAKRESTRRRHLLACVAGGTLLQAAAYARFGAGAGLPVRGRYVYLDPSLPADRWSFTVEAEDGEVAEALAAAVDRLAGLAAAGPFFPRCGSLPGADSRACDRCEYREACVAGDTESVRRLEQLHSAVAADPPGPGSPLGRLVAVAGAGQGEGRR